MRREALQRALVTGIFVAGGLGALAQEPATPAAPPAPSISAAGSQSQSPAVTGGRLHGTVKSGNIPLPGVTVTAQNTLTGKRYSTTTGINGGWTLTIAQNGRYVIRTQFAAFAPGVKEAVLNAGSHDQAVNFELTLASRVVEQQENEPAQSAIRQMATSGALNLSLMSALGADTETQAGPTGLSGAALPSIAGDTDFGEDSVAISGQSGTVSPLAGLDSDRVRDAIETLRAQGILPGGQYGQGGGNFGGLGGSSGGGFGGRGGFGGGGRGSFRGFNPGQPHGAIFWIGGNSALSAEPFSLRGQPQRQPASGTNRFAITFISAPFLPGVTKPSGKDAMFFTLSGQRSSSPLDDYATVPTDASFPGTVDERTGNIPGLTSPITPVQVATNLLQFIPLPNLPGYAQNYHLLTTAQTNSTQAGGRYMRSLGKNATLLGMGRGGRRAQQNQGLRQSINFNYNWIGSATDNVNVFPQLGGKSATNSNSLQAGYTVGYHKATNIFNANWNRATSQATNFFTNTTDIATTIGVLGPSSGSLPASALNSSPLNFGLPDVTLSNFTGMNEQQPSFVLSQTISISETLSWIHGQHNIRMGGDYRRVHHDFLGGANSTGTFYFTGLYTGSALGDFLLGEPEGTSVDSSVSKSYLRENVWDAYATDDWRARPNLTFNYGLRYEYFAPNTEKYGHLAIVDTNPAITSTYPALFSVADEVQAGGSGSYNGPLPNSLVYPFRVAVAPRLGMALRLFKQIVVRAGYGINYTVSQYATFATIMAHQPMVNDPSFVNEQTNNSSHCPSTTIDCLSLANGFPAPATVGNYALDPHYRLPYVQVWNLDVQKTMPRGVVVNVGYNGSKGSNLDITSAPRPAPTSPIFNYDQSVAFSRFNAGTLRVNRRLSNGIALGANYQYSHSIDNAGSVGGTSTVVAQNWQDLGAEEGNSSFDVRHHVTGTYLCELPFGEGRRWMNSGVGSHILEGFSASGSFTFATGQPLSPTYQATVSDVENGTAGTQRPNRVPGVSVTMGAGSKQEWFNPAAFVQPPNDSTTPNCPNCGNVSRNSIGGPGTIQNNMSLSKTMQLGGTRSMELRATATNAFNTVQYSGVDTNAASPSFGQVTQVAAMRMFQFTARLRF